MRKRIVLILLLLLVSLSLVACNEKSVQEQFDNHEPLIQFIGADGNQWCAFWYDVSYFPNKVDITCYQTDNDGNTLRTRVNKYSEFIGVSNDASDYFSYIAPNTYIYFQTPDIASFVNGEAARKPFVEGNMEIRIVDLSTDKTLASFTIYYTPPAN